MYYFEIIVSSSKVSKGDWLLIVDSLTKFKTIFNKIKLYVLFDSNVIRYVIESDVDISNTTLNIEDVFIKEFPKEKLEAFLNKKVKRKFFISTPKRSKIVDWKEKRKVNNEQELEFVEYKIKKISSKIFVKAGYCLSGIVVKKHIGNKIYDQLAIDFNTYSSYLKSEPPVYLGLEKTSWLFKQDDTNALMKVNTFPYMNGNYYLDLFSYDFFKHSLILGSSGYGKSKFIEIFIRTLSKKSVQQQYKVVVVDPHNSLAVDLVDIENSLEINFGNSGAQLFPQSSIDMTAATELTTTLFKSLMSGNDNPRLERVLRFSLYTLYVAQAMGMTTLKNFLTDSSLRNNILDHVKDFIPENIIKFFGSDFNEIKSKYYNEAIQPIISMVDEMQFHPTLVDESQFPLLNTINENFLTVFSLNKVTMGEKVVRTVAGLLIQQIFLLAQSRSFDGHIILVIDEVSVVQNPTLAAILAEARKFNLSVILTQQYFSQVDKELQSAILSNVVNHYIFKVSQEDARVLEGNITIEIPKNIIEREHNRGIEEQDLRVKILTDLSPRECIVRISASDSVLPAFAAKTVDTKKSNKSKIHLVTATHKLPEKFNIESSKNTSVEVEIEEENVNLETKSEVSVSEIFIKSSGSTLLNDPIEWQQHISTSFSQENTENKIVRGRNGDVNKP